MKGQQAACQPLGRAPPCSTVQQACRFNPSGSDQTAENIAKSSRPDIWVMRKYKINKVEAATKTDFKAAETEPKSDMLAKIFLSRHPVIPASDGGGGNSG